MSETWKTVRIFISSTFRDMHAERDYLIRFVLPELKERCAKQRLHLVDVDLRWGITEAETEQGKALEICLDEIDRCRPFFIGLLGERYGWVPDTYDVPDEPRYDWVRKLKSGYSITALEIYHGVLRDPVKAHRAFFYFRDPAFLSDPTFLSEVSAKQQDDFKPENQAAEAELAQLKGEIRQHCQGRVFEKYPCTYTGIGEDRKVKLGGLEAFGKQVLENLWSAIEQEYAAQEAPLDEIAKERMYYEAFIESRCQRFIGRQNLLQRMIDYANGNDTTPLVVVGTPGSGKSALLAKFARTYAETHPDVFVLPYFIGVSPGSTDIKLTLLRLCRELARQFGIWDTIPQNYEELRQKFLKLLEEASAGGKVLLLLDSLNQLDETYHAHQLGWLPRNLPAGVRMIVSTIEGDCLDALHRRSTLPEIIVEPLALEERKELVRQTLGDYRKQLDERGENDQMDKLLRKRESGNPLYLIVACEELRVFGDFERVTQKIDSLADEVPILFDQVLERLEHDHGKTLVKRVLSLLACSREGLLEKEILELLRRKGEERFPQTTWASLYRSLQFYLRPPGETDEGTLDFFHQQLATAVRKRYLASREEEMAGHRILATYFQRKADPAGNRMWTGKYPRGLSELPYQQTMGKLWDHLYATLTDTQFLEQKVAMDMVVQTNLTKVAMRTYTGVYLLQADFEFALSLDKQRNTRSVSIEPCFPESDARRATLVAFGQAIRREAHLLSEYPHLLWQQLYNRLQWADDAIRQVLEAERKRRNFQHNSPWLRLTVPDRESSGIARSLIHKVPPTWKGRIEHCAINSNGTWMLSSGSGALIVWNVQTGERQTTLPYGGKYCIISPDDMWFASLSGREIRIWDAVTWEELAIFTGPEGISRAAALSGDGTRIAMATDNILTIWDVETRQKVITLTESENNITACAFSPNGALFASADSDDGLASIFAGRVDRNDILRIWDTKTWKVLYTIKCSTKGVSACVFSPDSTWLVSAGYNGLLKIWNTKTGEQQGAIVHTQFSGIGIGARDCAISLDGKRIISVGNDHMVKIWNVQTRKQLGPALKGHNHEITTCAWSPDSTFAISGDSDGLLRVWDLRSNSQQFTPTGHHKDINACAISPKGDFFVTASDDCTLKMWDTMTGQELRTLDDDDHRDQIVTCAISPDGTFIISAEDDGCLHMWDGQKEWRRLTLEEDIIYHRHTINACAVSPDGSFIVLNEGRKLKILDAPSWWRREAPFEGHEDFITVCTVSPDGSRIVSGDQEGTLKVWDAEARQEYTTLKSGSHKIAACSISPDGTFMVSANSADGYSSSDLQVWNTETWEVRHTLGQGLAGIVACAVSPDGALVVSASRDGTIQLWDPSTGKERATLKVPGISGELKCLELHPWRPFVLCCGTGGTMYLMDLEDITYSPIIVTAMSQGDKLVVHCPVCFKYTAIDESQLGQVLVCPQGDCEMQINRFILKPRQLAGPASLDSSELPRRSWWQFWRWK